MSTQSEEKPMSTQSEPNAQKSVAQQQIEQMLEAYFGTRQFREISLGVEVLADNPVLPGSYPISYPAFCTEMPQA